MVPLSSMSARGTRQTYLPTQAPQGFQFQQGIPQEWYGWQMGQYGQPQYGLSQSNVMMNILAEARQRQQEARAANEARYQQLLAETEQRGGQEREDIRQRYEDVFQRGRQDLTSAGLAGTTALGGLRRGVAEAETGAAGRLEERLRGERMGIIERREDIYPQAGQLAQIAAMAGRGAGAGGGRQSYTHFGPARGPGSFGQSPWGRFLARK